MQVQTMLTYRPNFAQALTKLLKSFLAQLEYPFVRERMSFYGTSISSAEDCN